MGFLLLNSFYTVDERQKAMVLQFGQVRAVKEQPGLAFKIPFIQNVVYYDSRIQGLDTNALEVTPLDDRRLIVDAFARWRISDVQQFRRAVGVGGMNAATQRLEAILNANVREVLGSVPSQAVLSADRVGLMNRIRDQAIVEARDLGIEIIDVRLKRADLPEQNLTATFDRMKAEREREAADERARGNEAAQRVRAQADRTAIEIVSEADRDAQVIRGESDAERNRILADAYGADPEFFAFMRSMDAYKKALKADNATMLIEPDSSFFDYLRSPDPSGAAVPAPRCAAGAGAERGRRSELIAGRPRACARSPRREILGAGLGRGCGDRRAARPRRRRSGHEGGEDGRGTDQRGIPRQDALRARRSPRSRSRRFAAPAAPRPRSRPAASRRASPTSPTG